MKRCYTIAISILFLFALTNPAISNEAPPQCKGSLSSQVDIERTIFSSIEDLITHQKKSWLAHFANSCTSRPALSKMNINEIIDFLGRTQVYFGFLKNQSSIDANNHETCLDLATGAYDQFDTSPGKGMRNLLRGIVQRNERIAQRRDRAFSRILEKAKTLGTSSNNYDEAFSDIKLEATREVVDCKQQLSCVVRSGEIYECAKEAMEYFRFYRSAKDSYTRILLKPQIRRIMQRCKAIKTEFNACS